MAEENRDWNERYAARLTPWDIGTPSKELQRVLAESGLRPCRALELGCGTGTNALFLAQMGFEVTAADVSELAIKEAGEKAGEAGVQVRFIQSDVLNLPDLGPAFPFVFDRGLYHVIRTVDLEGYLRTLDRYSERGGYYLTLAGNANESKRPTGGPPRVYAHDLCRELAPLYDLVHLREFRLDAIPGNGQLLEPLAWSALLRRR
jgi:ubiquinone/menaquinone biosynthesis C-methylase UbiE